MMTFGIDPGLTGGIALLAADGSYVTAAPLPVIRDRALSWIDGGELRSFIFTHREGLARVVIERVSAMPGQGVSSMFCFGMTFGSILGVIQAIGLPIDFVTPATWKRDLGLSKDKDAALDKARLLFPDAPLTRKKDDGVAEALLIAHWSISQRTARAA